MVWSEEDEIVVLNEMVDFKDSAGNVDMVAFHAFIKGKLKVDFSRDRLRRKMVKMKNRFVNASNKMVN